MTRSLNISFPLPRRPSASPHTTPGSQYSNQSNIDDSPLSHPGAKAERVLGALEADGPESKKKSKKEKRQLRRYPSFMSITLSEVDAEIAKTPDEFPFPGMQTPHCLVSQPTRDKDRQGSSALRGEPYTFGSTIGSAFSKASNPQARRAGSSSTLRSHYDPKKSPLSISQQTSASSARDMALRKGFPPISSPLSVAMGETVKSSRLDGLHSRNISADTKLSEDSKLSGNSVRRINNIPRRRPSVMDPPTLYPNAIRAFNAVSPPPALIDAALPRPLGPQSQQKPSFSRPRWWAKVKTQIPPPNPLEDPQRHEDFDNFSPSFKVNVKKPIAKPKAGMRNWFDGLEDEENASDGYQDIEVSIQEPYKSPPRIREVTTHGVWYPQIPERKYSFGNHSEPTTVSDKKSSFRFDSRPVRSYYSGSSSQAPEDVSTAGSSPGSPNATVIQEMASSKGPLPGMDLQLVSFLELSSSEDEVENTSDVPYRCYPIRASIEKASYNNEVSVGNAQRAQPVRPRSIVNGRNRALSRISNSSEKVPPVPKIPDKPRVSERTSSVRWREMMEGRAGSTESTVDSQESSLRGSIDVRRATRKAKQTIRRSRFMKVTSEEEALLEAMRGKRASIRQDDFDKGFKTAMQLQDIVARPKTAGADGRASPSSNFRSRCSTSPPLREYALKMSGTDPRFSASAEDLRLGDSYPFPKVPSNRKGHISPSKPSPSPSFSPSDILPETPASHNSPVTPPGHGGLGGHGRNMTLSPARGVTGTNKIGHERERAVSSSIIDIDGVEQQPQVMDEDGVSRWATERW